MSKSMWIEAVDCTPVQDISDCSVDVLFWVEGEESPDWGYYLFFIDKWYSITKLSEIPAKSVKYFAYIDNPYK